MPIVHEEYRALEKRGLKAVKDTDDFGGPNMWHLYVELPNGRWKNLQWVDVKEAEQILGRSLPRYKQNSTTSRINPDEDNGNAQ